MQTMELNAAQRQARKLSAIGSCKACHVVQVSSAGYVVTYTPDLEQWRASGYGQTVATFENAIKRL